MRKGALGISLAAALAVATPAAAVNTIPGHTTSVASDGVHGVLRAGSEWGPGSTASDLDLPVDDLFAPEFQQWNNGSYWWDEDPSVNAAPVHYTIELDGLLTLRCFVVQADDNDSYLLEWWDGGAWQTAWAIPPVFSFGLVTRDSGALGPVTTSRLRLSATSGDNYYAISEVQAFAVPEPASWLLMVVGFGLAGLGFTRRRRANCPDVCSLVLTTKSIIATSALLGALAAVHTASAATFVAETTYGGHTYQLWDESGISWQTAQANANGLGGYLAVLTDFAETTAVYEALIGNGFFQPGDSQDIEAWLGATPADGSTSTLDPNNWAWVTGEAWTAFDVSNWAAFEPNGDSEGLAINRFGNSQWNDEGTLVGGYIVEVNSVPESCTLALLGLGLAGLGLTRRCSAA